MPAYRTCSTCGKPTTNDRYCDPCTPHGRASRSPTTRAQDAEYRRNRAAVLEGQPTCAYCPRPATTVDHVRPVSKGGTNKIDNLVPACAWCNGSKGARDDWQPAHRTRTTEPEHTRPRTTPGFI